ncbi:hypothetical protein SKAU_G00168710 [Synaphobranchus kaupii]|uniref:Uncharacterized protein n=1 Tax=Synaphobranchus kaupii TaxID=118154 RepID=A0A9Q1IZL1_SYNKA|nr:hypothetical protein SKAU_G00168710 [Synaphobranchus kaupii]
MDNTWNKTNMACISQKHRDPPLSKPTCPPGPSQAAQDPHRSQDSAANYLSSSPTEREEGTKTGPANG